MGQELLGLTDEQAKHLFAPQQGIADPRLNLECSYADISAYNAADVLYHFANTSEIHWFADCACGDCTPNGMGECVDCGDTVAHDDNPELCTRCEEQRSEGDEA